MSETSGTIPPKGLGSLSLSDFWKSLFLAALMNILLSTYAIINTGAWPTHADFAVMMKSTFAIVLSYLIKNLGTNNVGQLFTKDKPVVSVDAGKLEAITAQADQTKPGITKN